MMIDKREGDTRMPMPKQEPYFPQSNPGKRHTQPDTPIEKGRR